MKRSLHTNHNLIITKVRNFQQRRRLVRPTVENNNRSILEQKTKSDLSNESTEKAGNFEKTKLHIKYMVSRRCKMAVKSVLKNLGLYYSKVELGQVEIIGSISDEKREQLISKLLFYGFELVEDRKLKLVEKIKNVIDEKIHCEDELPEVKWSVYVSEKLNNEHPYPYLSHQFAEVTGTTIEHYIIIHKIEHAKEMIIYHNELTLDEIAWKLHYSSVAHLCNQFKQITGLTPTSFKTIKRKRIAPLEHS